MVNSKIEGLYQEIGREALQFAGDVGRRLLLYCEVDDGVSSADLFWVPSSGTPVNFRFAPDPLRERVIELWEEWKKHPGQQEWRAMAFVIEDGSFNVDLAYPDQVDEDEDTSERRDVAVTKYFGDLPVDYSQA